MYLIVVHVLSGYKSRILWRIWILEVFLTLFNVASRVWLLLGLHRKRWVEFVCVCVCVIVKANRILWRVSQARLITKVPLGWGLGLGWQKHFQSGVGGVAIASSGQSEMRSAAEAMKQQVVWISSAGYCECFGLCDTLTLATPSSTALQVQVASSHLQIHTRSEKTHSQALMRGAWGDLLDSGGPATNGCKTWRNLRCWMFLAQGPLQVEKHLHQPLWHGSMSFSHQSHRIWIFHSIIASI